MTLVAVLVGIGTVRAQTPAPPSPEGRGYGEVTFGPTFGHKSSGSIGAEAGFFFLDQVGAFAEAGRMSNIATSQIDAKALIIAGAINATFQAKQPATYFDVGVVKRFSPLYHVTPYALVGLGGATVSNRVTFTAGGSSLTSQQLNQLGVQLGTDLSGSYTKVFVTFGAGARMTLRDRWIADVSYRFGHVGANATSENNAISTNRLQFGVGAKF